MYHLSWIILDGLIVISLSVIRHKLRLSAYHPDTDLM